MVSLSSVALFLHRTLSMPFLSDDTFNSYLDGWIGYERLTPSAAIDRLFVATNLEPGRFYPLYTALLWFDFHVVHGAATLKAIVLFAIVLNALTFYVVVRIVVPAVALPALGSLPAML